MDHKTVTRTSIKYIISCIALLLFIFSSCLLIDKRPGRASVGYRTTELKQKTCTEGNQERLDYYDDNGNLALSSDLGYSTKIITKDEKSTKEAYYDPDGLPIMCNRGYYSKLIQYDEDGNKNLTVYLDENGNPTLTSMGYSYEKITYDILGRIEMVLFFDASDNPVLTKEEGCGKRYDYFDDGNVSKITYLDQNNEPMITTKGYAISTRTYYSMNDPGKGKVKTEFYFDELGIPICGSMGEYGVLKGYNDKGENTFLTYLDKTGNPMVTRKGYTTIWWGYQDGYYTVKYYDQYGVPYRLSQGQYGIQVQNGHTVFLNADGTQQFNLKIFLQNNPIYTIVFAIVGIVFSSFTVKRINVFLMLICLGTILYFTLLYREENLQIRNAGFLRSYQQLLINDEARSDIIKNIWLFIPLGAVLYRLYPNKVVLVVPIIISILVEAIQYITRTGYCELDDLISNGLGGIIGFAMCKHIRKASEKILLKSTIING